MKTETKHYLDSTYPNGVERTEKTVKIFGIVVSRKIYYYPKIKHYEVERM